VQAQLTKQVAAAMAKQTKLIQDAQKAIQIKKSKDLALVQAKAQAAAAVKARAKIMT